ncbi:MAG: hypothetical protein Q4E54_02205, partial [Lachnospiraceae bacterium]|nr:hypothetical protein [Lachnospiraceae bacterium]
SFYDIIYFMKMLVYKIFYFFVKLFYPKTEFVGRENLPDGPCIIAANHCQMHGPVACMLYYPREKRIWCIGEMMHMKEVPAYAYKDFWSLKPAGIKWFYKVLSYIIAPFAECIFQSADTIGVYHDRRISQTFRDSVTALKNRQDVIVFAEAHIPHNNIVFEFQKGFVDVARLYHKETGEEVSFVPMYVCPAFKKVYFGKPVRYDSGRPAHDERVRISEYLMDEVTNIGRSLPRHTVVPFENVSKDKYPENI